MKKILILMAAVVLLAGCKEDNWMDWKAQNEMWLEQNLKSDSTIHETEDGLQYKIITMGNTTDARPQSGGTAYCDYTGRLINGYQFDSEEYASLTMTKSSESGSTIDGFVEGLEKIHVHGDIILYIPWDLAYGEDGTGTEGTSSFIPPYSTLIFEVHLCAVSN